MKCPCCAGEIEVYNDNNVVFKRGNATIHKENLESWASFVAVDSDGCVYQYANKPILEGGVYKDGTRSKLCGMVCFACDDYEDLLFEVNTTNTSQLHIVVADMFFNDSWNTVVIDSDTDKSKCDSLAQELKKHNNYRNVKVMLATEIEKE